MAVALSSFFDKPRLASWVLPCIAAVAMLWLVPVSDARASFCSASQCIQTLDQESAGLGGNSANFGTVSLTLSGTTVTVDVKLGSGWTIVNDAGIPGSFGFHDNLGGGLTIGNFSSSAYKHSQSDSTADLQFGGFGNANDAAATNAPQAGNSNALNEVSFTVSKNGLTDVRDLLNLFAPAGSDGPAYFVVDAFNGAKSGLLAISRVPEPASLALLGTGIIIAVVAMRRRRII